MSLSVHFYDFLFRLIMLFITATIFFLITIVTITNNSTIPYLTKGYLYKINKQLPMVKKTAEINTMIPV